MKGIKICKRCGKKILHENKAVMLMTFQGYQSLEKVYWHWQCFLDWRDESINNRAEKKIMAVAKSIDLSSISKQLNNMLVPQNDEIIVEKAN